MKMIKSEDIIVDTTNEYNSDDVEDDLQLALEDPGGDSYNQKVNPKNDRQHQQQAQRRNILTISQNSESRVETIKNSLGPKNSLETEKRMRREIANSNERRRMQSINAGFQNLRALLPRHEGEKLSKAAILQQTSQYILDLEDEKTALLSQNSQLKRILGEQEGGGNANLSTNPSNIGNNTNTNNNSNNNSGLNPPNGVVIKKRKLTDNVITLHTISDSSDEGLGSMSPEPMTLLTNVGGNIAAAANVVGLNKSAHGGNVAASYATVQSNVSTKDLLELKKELDKERRLRTLAEEELRLIKRQLYQANFIPREVIEHTDNIVRETEISDMQYFEIKEDGHQQVVVCSSIDDLPDDGEEFISEENIQEDVIVADDSDTKYTDSTVLQPILQAAIKATPKVEVERINETMKVKSEKIDCNQTTNNITSMGLTRSRQNLETIVEAIRHLEGDHLFGDLSDQHKHKIQITSQETPLALTTKQQQQLQLQQQHHSSTSHALRVPTQLPLQQQNHNQEQQQQQQQRKTIAELSPFLQIKNAKSVSNNNLVTIVNGASITLASPSTIVSAIGQLSASNNNNISSAKISPSVVVGTGQVGVGPVSSSSSNSNNNTAISLDASVSNSSSCNTAIQQHHQQDVATPTAIVKVQTASTLIAPTQVTVTTTALKQCRPGVIVAKQVS